MTIPVAIYGGAATRIRAGGRSIPAVYGGVLGGVIANPSSPADQGIFFKQAVQRLGPSRLHGPFNSSNFNQTQFNGRFTSQVTYTDYIFLPTTEDLFVDFTGPAALEETATTIRLFPGNSISIPEGQADNVWVNAATTGHRFSVFVIQVPTVFPPVPVPGDWPPDGVTNLLKTIKSYLYEEYTDDDDLQNFVDSYNQMTQNYVDTFNSLNLPIYTWGLIVGRLLDWVAKGLYGMDRPSLSSGKSRFIGPFNTYQFNTVAFNSKKRISSQELIETTDDLFKRILTWHFFKGDGRVFDVRWLKRRILRFLNGANGINVDTAATYDISVQFASKTQVNITIATNGSPTQAILFQEAVNSGALELPFQFTFNVTVI